MICLISIYTCIQRDRENRICRTGTCVCMTHKTSSAAFALVTCAVGERWLFSDTYKKRTHTQAHIRINSHKKKQKEQEGEEEEVSVIVGIICC